MNFFQNLVDRFANAPSDELTGKLVDQVERNSLTDEDIAYLALRLAESGKILPQFEKSKSADIASTGGPGSLSTILCPIYLRALGFTIPKLAIPGRPAGSIDVFAQIPGYKIELTVTEVETLLRKNGFVHFLASRSFAPLDASLYSYRRKLNKVNITDLAVASILSKKKAAGVSLVGLDVRVAPHGNFGSSFSTATLNANRFCRVASLLDCNALCFLTDANKPYQPFIGRGEALIALYQIIIGNPEPWLRKHDDTCYAMVQRLVRLSPLGNQYIRPTADVLFSVFRENLENQGSSMERFEQHISEIREEHIMPLTASQKGFVHISIASLRTLIVGYQNLTSSAENHFSDPCGVIIKKNQGSYVHKGELIATVRCIDRFSEDMLDTIASAIIVKDEPPRDAFFKEVSNE